MKINCQSLCQHLKAVMIYTKVNHYTPVNYKSLQNSGGDMNGKEHFEERNTIMLVSY